jgi:aldehyde:ferredoxin oxidoreductase
MGKILDVDLSARETSVRDTMPYAHDYIGGRALASRIAWDEIPAGIDAYDPENRVIVATGPLTGTLAPTAGRTVMTSTSPRVYPKPWYTFSTLGGWFGPEMKYAGFDAIVIHGQADTPVYLEIQDDRAQLVDAPDLWGLDARETQLTLKKRLGSQAQVLTIGPGGFGAVWGSKNLKAIAIRGTGGVSVANPDALLKEVLAEEKDRYSIIISSLYEDGAKPERPVCSQSCLFSCLASSYGHTIDGRRTPGQCIGGLAWVSDDSLVNTKYSGGGAEIPPSKNFGRCEETSLHEMCNSLGLDLWFRIVMQPWFIRCNQLGVHQIRGYPIEPNDLFWFEQFMHELARREGLGAVFAEDLRRAMDDLEGELPDELIYLGRELEFNFGFPAHREGRFWDEEPLPFWVISAMMHASTSRDPTIGTHHSSMLLADFLLVDRDVALPQFRRLSEQVWGYPDALEPSFDNKAPVAIWSQHQHMLIDSLTLCDFAFPQLVRPMETQEEWRNTQDLKGDLDLDLRLLAAVTGSEKSREELTEVAERAFNLERAMLARAGRGRPMEESLAPHFELPCRADGTLIDEAGFSRLLDEYYSARGWDLELGWPQADQLKELALEEVIPELAELRG